MSDIRIITKLSGVRFDVDVEALRESASLLSQMGLRAGSGPTVEAEADPVCGPVYLVEADGSVHAWCRGCGATSSSYKARVCHIYRWSDEHRCAPLVLG